MRIAIALALLVACGKKGDDTADLPPPITLLGAANATKAEATLPQEDADLVAAENVLGMTVDMLVSDNTIKNTFFNNGDLGTTPIVLYVPCWTVPAPGGVSGFSYDADLSGCSDEGFSGTVHVDNSTFGPVILTFENTQILDWVFNGSLSFRVGANNDRTWVVYNSDANSTPGPALNVETPNGSLGLNVAGGLQMSLNGTSTFDWWNSTTDSTRTLGVGGPAAGESGTEDPETHLTYALMPDECRCQKTGDVVFPSTAALTSVTIDIDDMIDGDDGVDDPEVRFEVASSTTGVATLSAAVDCGKYDATFAADGGGVITLAAADLAAGFKSACDNGEIQDDGKCTRLAQAASGGSVQVTLRDFVLKQAITTWTENTFDDGICFTGLVSTGPPG